MKRIFKFLKYKSKRFIYKFLKFILPIMFSLIIVFSSTLPAYATEWEGDGITLDVYSSYFWDKENGIHKITPLIDYNSNRSKVTFQTHNGYAYNDSHLYVFCEIKDIESFYGYFHVQFVGHNSTLNFKEDSGIYTIGYGPNGESTFGEKIINFENVNDSNITMYVSNNYPLPNKFLIFISYTHSFDFEVKLTAIDLSYTKNYPMYDDGLHNKDTLIKEEDLLLKSYNDFENMFDGVFANGNINGTMYKGLLFAKSFFDKFLTDIPVVEDILKFSLSIGMCAFVLGFFVSVVGSVTNKVRSNNSNKKGGG